MSKRRKRRQTANTAKKRRLEAAVQTIQQKWGQQALHKGPLPTAVPVIPGLSTGLSSLDRILVPGGLPLGHISELIGHPTSGKRTLALHILAQTQQRYPCVYVDLAQTFDPAYAAACHVDLSQLAIAAPADPVQALDLACDLTAGGHFGLVVFDSTAELLTGAFHPGATTAVLRRLRQALNGKASALLFLTTSFDDAPGSSDRTALNRLPGLLYPAGFTLPQAAALRLMVSRQRWLHKSGTIHGYEAQVTVLHSRWDQPGRQTVIQIKFNGINVEDL